MSHVVVIAEVGECFNGDMQSAYRLIEVSKDAGCDIVKFQTLDYDNISADDPESDWFRKIALDEGKIKELVACGSSNQIEVLFTPENVKTAQWLVDAGLKSVKIASSCIWDSDLIKYIGNNFRKVFISTGMATLDEVCRAVEALSSVEELYIMHCISEYPTGRLLEERGLVALKNKDVSLNMMKMLMTLFPQHMVGYSDHTDNVLAPVAAVAAGAKVIEKHITLDRETPIRNFNEGREYLGTDHVLSLEPDELKQMVAQIREVETMFGEWKWQRTEGERLLKTFMRERFVEKG